MSIDGIVAQFAELPIARTRWVGVYLLVRDEALVYIGQSTDIESRIGLHRTQGPIEFDRAFWFPVCADDLDAYEGALIRRLAPLQTYAAPADDSRDAEVLAVFGLQPCAEKRGEFEQRRREKWGERSRRIMDNRHVVKLRRKTRWLLRRIQASELAAS